MNVEEEILWNNNVLGLKWEPRSDVSRDMSWERRSQRLHEDIAREIDVVDKLFRAWAEEDWRRQRESLRSFASVRLGAVGRDRSMMSDLMGHRGKQTSLEWLMPLECFRDGTGEPSVSSLDSKPYWNRFRDFDEALTAFNRAGERRRRIPFSKQSGDDVVVVLRKPYHFVRRRQISGRQDVGQRSSLCTRCGIHIARHDNYVVDMSHEIQCGSVCGEMHRGIGNLSGEMADVLCMPCIVHVMSCVFSDD